MKCIVKVEDKAFKPVSVSIILETQKELDTFDSIISEAIENGGADRIENEMLAEIESQLSKVTE